MKSLPVIRGLLAGILVLGLSVADAADDALSRARILIEQGNPAKAYELLEPLETEQAGNPDFDYLFGIAALDSGEKTRAVFALERVLAVNPEHQQARAEIARAYFELNEKDTAKKEFESLKDQGVPPQVQQTLDRYLAAIDQAIGDEQTRISGFFAVGTGYDSNINAATDESRIAIPLFGGAITTLSSNGIEDASMFLRIEGGVSLVHLLADKTRFLAGASAFNYDVAGDFDTRSVSLYTGLAHDFDPRNSLSIIAQGNLFRVDGEPFRNSLGASLQWTHRLDQRSQLSVYYQGADLHYVTQEIRNASRHTFGAAYTRALNGARAAVLFAGLYGGRENEDATGVAHLGHSFIGGRVGGELKLTPRISGYGSLAIEERDYGGQDPLFLKKREDSRYRAVAGLRYQVSNKWTLHPELSYTRNDSSIVINDYDRYTLGLSLRRDLP